MMKSSVQQNQSKYRSILGWAKNDKFVGAHFFFQISCFYVAQNIPNFELRLFMIVEFNIINT
jgi:hypothetical protein